MGLLVVVLLGAWVLPAAADAVSEQRQAKRKLLAQRAARADAMRKLAERIKGLRITSDTTVQDFVATTDTIETALRAWMLGMKEEGKYKHMADGTCEVEMSVTLRTVITELKSLYKAYYKGDKIKANDFVKIKQHYKFDKITVVGTGAMPEELDEEPLIPTSPTGRSMGKIPPYWGKHCTGQGRLMALRAARSDAMRRLAERIKGVRITSDTTVQDFVAESDEINVDMRAFLKGAKEIGTRYHRNELIVEVEMEVMLKTVIATFKSWADTHVKGDKVKIKALQDYVEKVRYDKIRETGMGIPPEKYLKGYTAEQVTILKVAQNAPPWATDTLRAKGQAALDQENPNKAQAKLMAYRAAELDARRKLAEKLDGLMITSNSSVRDFIAQNDEIETKMMTYQLGAKVLDSSKKLLPDGTAETTVEIDLKPLWNVIIFYHKKGVKIR